MRFQLAAAALALATMTACTSASDPAAPSTKPAPTVGAALAGDEWAVFEINGAGIVPNSTPTIKSVSYTHLDVYKRQAEGRAGGCGAAPRSG